jgi:hypothetical protein
VVDIGQVQVDEYLEKAVSAIFDNLDIKESLEELDLLIEHVEELVEADHMWHDAAEDEMTRRILVAAVGVIAIKFASMDDNIIDFINNEEKKEEK